MTPLGGRQVGASMPSSAVTGVGRGRLVLAHGPTPPKGQGMEETVSERDHAIWAAIILLAIVILLAVNLVLPAGW